MILKKFKQTFFTTVLILSAFSSQAIAEGCVNWAKGTFVPKTNALGQKLPDDGIYWFKADGSRNSHELVMKACRYNDHDCASREKHQGYFNPNKPTVIFIHGWAPDSTKGQTRFDFCYQYSTGKNTLSPVYNTLQPWKGYNVGVFYWNQFADESQIILPEAALVAAEAKIYSTNGTRGMEWKYIDKAGVEQVCRAGDSGCLVPKEDITDMAFDAYKQALPADYKNEIRITAQSLGAQVAIQLTAKIMQHPLMPQPTRLALLDPYFSVDGKFAPQNNIPNSVADYNSDTVHSILTMYHQRHLLSGQEFPIAVYRSSTVSFAPLGNPALALMDQVAYLRVYPVFIKGLDAGATIGADHVASSYLYFISKDYAPNKGADNASDFNQFHIDARSDTAAVVKLMTYKRYEQVDSADRQNYAKTWKSKFNNVPLVTVS